MDYKTKKGNIYQLNGIQPRKQCKGYRMVLADNLKGSLLKYLEDEKIVVIRKLAIHGTTDILQRGMSNKISKQISIEHPNDKGYFKKVFVLSEAGKKLLNKHKVITKQK